MSRSPYRQQQQQQQQQPQQPTAAGLSPSWSVAYDQETQARYYYNAKTNESQWNTPQQQPQLQRTTSSSGKQPLPAPHRDSYGSPHHMHASGSGSARALAALQLQTQPSLPPPWESAVDPETQTVYYFNPDTQESQWHAPEWPDLAAATVAAAASPSGSGSARQQAKAAFAEAYMQGLASVPEGREERSPGGSSLAGDSVSGSGGGGATLGSKPSPRTSAELGEFLETKEETQARKFEKMKAAATVLRELRSNADTWVEWQMNGGGAVFYSKAGTRGGQWQKPLVFENAQAVARVGGVLPAGAVPPGLDAEADRARIEASRLQQERARLSKSWEYGFGGSRDLPAMGVGDGNVDDWALAAEQARAGLESIKRREQQEEHEAEAFDPDESEAGAGAGASTGAGFGSPSAEASRLAQRVKIVVTGARDKNAQQEAYKTLRQRDAVVEQQLQLSDMQKRVDRAKERWKEFVGPTFPHADGDEGEARGDKEGAKSGDAGRGSDEEEDSDDSEAGIAVARRGPGRAKAKARAGSAQSQAVDFDALYARAIVVRQRWPWTCLVDMKSDRLFYRHEVGDFFQLEAPPEFESKTEREERLRMQAGAEEEEDDDYDRHGSSSPSHTGRPAIQAGESASDFVSRFKDELKARREHLLAGKRKDRVALTTIAQEQTMVASEAEAAFERKGRGKTLSASSIVGKIRSFSEAHRVMEAAAVVRSEKQSSSRNLFARSGPLNGRSQDALQRKYAAPKLTGGRDLQRGPPSAVAKSTTAPRSSNASAAGDRSFQHTREKDAAELLVRLRRMAYEPKALFVNYKEEVKSKYRKVEKDDAKKGAFAEIPDNLNTTKRALAINDLRNQERSIATFIGIISDQLDVSDPSWVENEINRRHLLEAVVLQRNALVFPRTAREAKAYAALPQYMSNTHSLRLPADLVDLQRRHRVSSAVLGVWTYYTVSQDFDEGRTVNFYFNTKTGVVQNGEPFDIKCHRKREAFTLHKWSHYDRFLPFRSNFFKKGLQLLSDEEGGLLYYCPRRDKYSFTDKFDAEVNFASVRAALDAKKVKNKAPPASRNRRKEAPKDPGADVVPNYSHYAIPEIERDVLEFPEPNIWTSLLLPAPPSHAPSKMPPQRRPAPGASASLLTPTGRSRADKAKARPGSATRRSRSPSPGRNTLALAATATATNGNTPRSRPGSARMGATGRFSEGPDAASSPYFSPAAPGATQEHSSLARRFVAELDVPLAGGTLRPFSAPFSPATNGFHAGGAAGKQRPSSSQSPRGTGTLGLITTSFDASPMRGVGSASPFSDRELARYLGGSSADFFGGPGATGATAVSSTSKLPQLQFEFDLDSNNYIEFRTFIKKISDKPRDPVLLLELANFLHANRLGNEALAVLERVLELLVDWKLTSENTALSRLLGFKMRLRYIGKHEKLRSIKSLAASSIDAPSVFAQCGQYLHKLQYHDTAEDLYCSALLLDPLCNEANRGLAHLLIERGNPHAAVRYLVRVSELSAAFSMVKVEQGWLQEILGSDDEAVLLCYKKALSLGLRDRATVCTLTSLGHHYHIRGDYTRAGSFYKRALMYAPCDAQALLLSAALGNTTGNVTTAQTDAWIRKGVIMQQGDHSRWIALLMQADTLVANFQDLSRAEELLWEAVRIVFSKEVWPTVALAHFYQYTRGDLKRARRLLLWADRRNAQLAANMHVPDDPRFPKPTPEELEEEAMKEKPIFGDSDRAALLVATGYTHIDAEDWEAATQCGKEALELAGAGFTSAYRLLGLAARRDPRSAKEAQRFFDLSVDSAGPVRNAHSFRTASVVAAMEGNFGHALKLMESAVHCGPSCQLAWRSLGTMMYLYARRVDTALTCLAKAIDLSSGLDYDALVLRGQILMESGQHAEARESFQAAMRLQPGDPILLASLALSLAALGFKPPAGKDLVFDYGSRLALLESLGQLVHSENPEELVSAAVSEGLDFALRKKSQERRASEGLASSSDGAGAAEDPSAGEQQAQDEQAKDVDPCVLYWCGMYYMNKGSKKAHAKAKVFFTRAVQRVDHPPHPLALYMLGWLAELRGDLSTAEKYYCYALQLEPMHPLAFLQLVQLAHDSLGFVKGLGAQIEVAEAARKKAIRRKNRLRQQGVSVPVAKEGQSASRSAELALAKKRLLLHERVLRLSELRTTQFGSKIRGLHAPGKCVHIDPFWLERLLHAFTECEDWASLLRSSGTGLLRVEGEP